MGGYEEGEMIGGEEEKKGRVGELWGVGDGEREDNVGEREGGEEIGSENERGG